MLRSPAIHRRTADDHHVDTQLTDPTVADSNTSVTPGAASHTGGVFDQSKCGLIPERHDNSRMAHEHGYGDHYAGILSIVAPTTVDDSTMDLLVARPLVPNAVARYDAGDESMSMCGWQMAWIWMTQRQVNSACLMSS